MKNTIFAFALALSAITACQKPLSKDTHTSHNSLDWQGTYIGTLPCADCEGILTTIQLNNNNTFAMGRKYLGKSTDINSVSGSFNWNKDGNQITLGGLDASTTPVHFKVGENKIIQLDLNGNPVSDNLSDRYVLTKTNNDITNKYWKLVTVNRLKVVLNDSQGREPHIIFHPDNHRVTGNGGCNSFGGTYTLTENNEITFGPLMATRMACMETMAIEGQLLKALSETSSYQVSGDSLRLFNREKSKLATFGVVWLR